MRILGIETSCDETAAAIIDVSGSSKKLQVQILSNIVASQAKLHAKFGGVVPRLARREHLKIRVPVLLMALRVAGLSANRKSEYSYDRSYIRECRIIGGILAQEPDLFSRMIPEILPRPAPEIDAIAVTVGPGLAPALWAGVNFARALGYLWGKPVIPVNHLEGHIYTNLFPANWRMSNDQFLISNFFFPALCLIVSGGHTELVLMRRYGDYRVIGETLDDASGEAFDKVAKMLGLGFPGGPIISRLAGKGNTHAFNFPRPMLHSKDFNFSFAGLKTAVLYTLRDLGRLGDRAKRDVAASFEQAVVDVLVAKTIRAAKQYRVKTVMIGGGVAANKRLRVQLGGALCREYPNTYYLTPDTSLTGDNALMISLAGYFNRKKKTAWRTVQADANLRLDLAGG